MFLIQTSLYNLQVHFYWLSSPCMNVFNLGMTFTRGQPTFTGSLIAMLVCPCQSSGVSLQIWVE